MNCKICGFENKNKSDQCRRCGTSLKKKPWYIRLNLFRRTRDTEIAVSKIQATIFKLHQDYPR